MSAPVQGTNDSCTVSKAAMVNRGYFKDPYVKHFVSAVVKRSPLINRGYFIRAYSVQALMAYLLKNASYSAKGHSGNKINSPIKQIVSLGAGFDTMFFRLRDVGATEFIERYIEVDANEVVERKRAMIEKHEILTEADLNVFKFLPGDLSNYENIFEKLKSLLDPQNATLFLGEVSLVYLPSETSDCILDYISENFTRSAVVLYEQLNTRDPFGKFMMGHFNKLNCPLGSPDVHNTIEKVHSRLAEHFKDVFTADLNHITIQTLPDDELNRVSKLELFDEFEELSLLNSHYALTLLVGKDLRVPVVFPLLKKLRCQCCVPREFLCLEKFPKVTTSKHLALKLEVFRHCSAVTNGGRLFLVGGFGAEIKLQHHDDKMYDRKRHHHSDSERQHPHSRLMYLADIELNHHNKIDSFRRVKYSLWERLNSSIEVCGDFLVIFGGRKSPAVAMNDIIKVDIGQNSFGVVELKDPLHWDELCPHPCPRYRHASAVLKRNYHTVEENQLLIDGGKDQTDSFSDAFLYDPLVNLWTQVEFSSGKDDDEDNKQLVIPPRHSHSICWWKDSTYILSGGILNNKETNVSHKLYQLSFSFGAFCTVEVIARNMLPVFGHTSHVYVERESQDDDNDSDDVTNEWLVIVGGATPVSSYSLIQIYDLRKQEMARIVRVNDSILINHTSHILSHRLYIVGGGGNMFSFGTYFNSRIKIYSIESILQMGQRNCETEQTPVQLPPPESFEGSASSQTSLNLNNNTKEVNFDKGEGGKEKESGISESKVDSANSDGGSMSPDTVHQNVLAKELLRAEVDKKMFGPAKCRTTKRQRQMALKRLKEMKSVNTDSLSSAFRNMSFNDDLQVTLDGKMIAEYKAQFGEPAEKLAKSVNQPMTHGDAADGEKEEKEEVKEELLYLEPTDDDKNLFQLTQKETPAVKVAKFVVEKQSKEKKHRHKHGKHRDKSSRARSPSTSKSKSRSPGSSRKHKHRSKRKDRNKSSRHSNDRSSKSSKSRSHERSPNASSKRSHRHKDNKKSSVETANGIEESAQNIESSNKGSANNIANASESSKHSEISANDREIVAPNIDHENKVETLETSENFETNSGNKPSKSNDNIDPMTHNGGKINNKDAGSIEKRGSDSDIEENEKTVGESNKTKTKSNHSHRHKKGKSRSKSRTPSPKNA